MAVQLYAFFYAGIHTDRCKIGAFLDSVDSTDGKFTVDLINGCNTFDTHKLSPADFF